MTNNFVNGLFFRDKIQYKFILLRRQQIMRDAQNFNYLEADTEAP